MIFLKRGLLRLLFILLLIISTCVFPSLRILALEKIAFVLFGFFFS